MNESDTPAKVGSMEGLGLGSERAFEAWAFDQLDFTTMQPWDVARSAYLAGMAAERERCAALCDLRSADHWHDYKTGPRHVRGVSMYEHASDEANACAAAIRAA